MACGSNSAKCSDNLFSRALLRTENNFDRNSCHAHERIHLSWRAGLQPAATSPSTRLRPGADSARTNTCSALASARGRSVTSSRRTWQHRHSASKSFLCSRRLLLRRSRGLRGRGAKHTNQIEKQAAGGVRSIARERRRLRTRATCAAFAAWSRQRLRPRIRQLRWTVAVRAPPERKLLARAAPAALGGLAGSGAGARADCRLRRLTFSRKPFLKRRGSSFS